MPREDYIQMKLKKQHKDMIEELAKKQAYVDEMSIEMHQQRMRPMLGRMMPPFMLWIFILPATFGDITALSPFHTPWIMCNDENVHNNTQPGTIGQPKGSCNVSGQVFVWGWIVITSFTFCGIISKITKSFNPLTGN